MQNFTKYFITGDPPEEKVTCFTLKFVIAFVIIGSVCLLGMIGNFLSLFVLAKIKVCKNFVLVLFVFIEDKKSL